MLQKLSVILIVPHLPEELWTLYSHKQPVQQHEVLCVHVLLCLPAKEASALPLAAFEGGSSRQSPALLQALQCSTKVEQHVLCTHLLLQVRHFLCPPIPSHNTLSHTVAPVQLGPTQLQLKLMHLQGQSRSSADEITGYSCGAWHAHLQSNAACAGWHLLLVQAISLEVSTSSPREVRCHVKSCICGAATLAFG